MMEGMKEVRTIAGEPNDLGARLQVGDDQGQLAAAEWEQQQLLPAGRHAPTRSEWPSDRLRRAGLVGIAQAREALAEAARRAQARSESRAA
jgi:hypothetical protein